MSGADYRGYVRPAYSVDHWEPDAGEIAELETHVAAESARARARGKIPNETDLATYTRQYYGYRHDGKKFIEVTFFCRAAEHLARQDVFVKGGGSCYLIAAYDVARQSFLYFRIRAK